MKRKIQDDPRYDAVGSSHLREELFTTYLKAQGSADTSHTTPPQTIADSTLEPGEEAEADKDRTRQERAERAVKEREGKIRAERSKVDAEIDRSRLVVGKEEGEREYRCARRPQRDWLLAPLTVTWIPLTDHTGQC